MMRIKTKLVALVVVCAGIAQAYGNDIRYTITDLGVLDGPDSYPLAINNRSEVVGYADIYTRYTQAFLYAGSGPLINLGSFGGPYGVSKANAINDQGMVVGYSDSSGTGNPTRAAESPQNAKPAVADDPADVTTNQLGASDDPIMGPDDKPQPPPPPPRPPEPQPLPDERAAVLAVKAHGGSVTYDETGRVSGAGCENPTESDLRLIASLPHLTNLGIWGAKVKDADLAPLVKASRLKALGISRSAITDDALKVIGQLAGLERLDLGSSNINGRGFAGLRLEHLRELDVNHCPIGDEGMHAIGQLLSLHRLSLGRSVTAKGLRELAPLSALEYLYLQKRVTDADLAGIGQITSLRTISTWWRLVTDQGLKGMQTLTKLRVLDLRESNVSDAGMAYVSRLTGLETLKVPTRIGDAGLAEIAKLPNLTSLDLSRTKVTDAGLVRIGTLHKLETLSLSGTKITDKGIADVVRLRNLKNLSLAYTEITDAGLARLTALPRLKYLSLIATHVTTAGVLRLRGLRGLISVQLSSTGISDRDLWKLIDAGIPVDSSNSPPEDFLPRE